MSQPLANVNSYDYIVVGAGSAGAALAARLSEDPAVSVLLLEAGPDYRSHDAPPEMRGPNPAEIILAAQYQHYHWTGLKARWTETQTLRQYWCGRGLGGSSAINGQLAIRGMLEDFDIWSELGCTGWAGAEVLPAFIRLEDDLDFGDAPYHGRGGPIPIYRAPFEHWGAVDLALYEAARNLGYGWAPDHNAPGSTGVSPYATNSRDGVRVSTNDAYLEPARDRPNLTIVGNALIDQVLLAERRAVGVRARIAGTWTQVRGREVMLCAGAIHSPAILLRSGIGSADELRALGIAPLVDLPGVGANLLDHPAAAIGFLLRPEARATSPRSRWINCCVRYSSGLADAGQNDMLIGSNNVVGNNETALLKGGLWVSVYRSFSRGRLVITSPDPDVEPEIDMRMLSDARDLVRLRDGVRRMIAIARHPAVTRIAERAFSSGWGNVERNIDEFVDDATIDDWLLAECWPAWHMVGTCRMGPTNDPRSVVDPQCRVIGTTGLRVIDAAIMPEAPRANTHLTTVMIAEHMAARILRSRQQ